MKEVKDLAVFGGSVSFDRVLHVGAPNVGNRDNFLRRVGEMLDSRWFTNKGPFVAEFEARLAQLLGVRHCVVMCNGTVALEIAARALDLAGEVIIPSFTFVATAHALQWMGITPVFADINPHTHNLDAGSVERLITPRTTGIVGVHVWGRNCATPELLDIAEKHSLKLMFDASHAFGCVHGRKMAGNHGEIEVFSFHATKFINTFEGGVAVTNDDELAQKMRLMKNFGFSGLDNVIYLGTNGKMSEISAAMGLTMLEDMKAIVDVNRKNYHAYARELSSVPGITIVPYDATERHNYQYVVVEVDQNTAHIDRDTLVKILHAENVRARRYFYPGCHRMEPYRSYYPNAGLMLPETERLCCRTLCLPTGPTISAEDIRTICAILRLIVTCGTEILQRVKFL